MLPPSLFSAYRQYKEDTDAVASWLAVTAKAHGYPADLLTANAPPPQRKSGRVKGKDRKAQQKSAATKPATAAAKYTVAIKDFVPLAEWIASRKPPVAVPSAFASIINRVIKVRSNFAGDISSHGVEPDEGHSFFVGILEKVREALKPRMPADVAQPALQKPDDPGRGLENTFAALEVYDIDDIDDTPIPAEQPTTAKPEEKIVYEAERPKLSMVDALQIYRILWIDLERIRNRIRWIWDNYRAGFFDAASAAIATNTAIDLARNLIDEAVPDFEHLDVWKVAQKFFFAFCVSRGHSVDDILLPNGQPNPATYDIQDATFMVAWNLLLSLTQVLPHDLPVYKDGMYGVYNPRRDRSKMSGPEKFQEDQILIMETFTELITISRAVRTYPVQDELLRGMKEMDKTRKVPFYLIFATQVFFDIHHVLRADATRPFDEMMGQITMMEESIREQTEFHKGLKFDNWGPRNEFVLKEVGKNIRHIQQDPVFAVKKKALERIGMAIDGSSHRHRLLRSSPVLAGLILFHFRSSIFEIGIAVANAFGSISYTWHLYNAARSEKLLTERWDDMEVVYGALGSSNFHVGGRPEDTYEYLKRFCLQMGHSVAAFVKQKPGARPPKLASRAGPRGIDEDSIATVSAMFRERYVLNSEQFNWTPEYVEQIVAAGRWEAEEEGAVEEGTVSLVQSDKPKGRDPSGKKKGAGAKGKRSKGGKLDADSLIESLTWALRAETAEFCFPYLDFRRKCWQLLRDVKRSCNSLLIEKYTPAYMERETELPWVVGYIFLAAAGSVEGSTRVKDMRLLQVASRCLEGMIEGGADEMMEIMNGEMGVSMQFEEDSEREISEDGSSEDGYEYY